MPITFTSGDITEFKEDIILNPVNCKGVSGKGLALQFKTKFPENQKKYEEACKLGQLKIGKPQVIYLEELRKCIINFPTKKDWQNPSKIEWIENGLKVIADNIERIKKHCNNAESIGIPKLGAGLGKLDWEAVRKVIVEKMENLDINTVVYGTKSPQKFDLATQKQDALEYFVSEGDPLKLISYRQWGLDKRQKWKLYFVQFNREIDPERLKLGLRNDLGLIGGRVGKTWYSGVQVKLRKSLNKQKLAENIYGIKIGRTTAKRGNVSDQDVEDSIRRWVSNINKFG